MLYYCMNLIHYNHDDVIKWKHFPRYCPFVRGIHRSPVNSPHKGQWRRALMFSLICVWINGWVNNREAGDLRRHRGHYDVNVMTWRVCTVATDGTLVDVTTLSQPACPLLRHRWLPRLCEPRHSETTLFLPVRCSFAVGVAVGGLGTARIFQVDFSYLCNEV